jgi:hypothetical protein
MKKFGFYFITLISVFAITAIFNCSTISKVNQTLDGVNKLISNVNSAIDAVKSAASTPTTSSPSQNANAPAIPAKATGGTDITSSTSGNTGTESYDIDGDGQAETVTVFVDASGVTFLSWAGDAQSDDAGICYLAWEDTSGVIWTIAAECNGAEGAFVCQESSNNVSCEACNTEGECNQCSFDEEECDWPSGSSGDQECQNYCLALQECELLYADETIEQCETDCEEYSDTPLYCVFESTDCQEIEDCHL